MHALLFGLGPPQTLTRCDIYNNFTFFILCPTSEAGMNNKSLKTKSQSQLTMFDIIIMY